MNYKINNNNNLSLVHWPSTVLCMIAIFFYHNLAGDFINFIWWVYVDVTSRLPAYQVSISSSKAMKRLKNMIWATTPSRCLPWLCKAVVVSTTTKDETAWGRKGRKEKAKQEAHEQERTDYSKLKGEGK